MNIKIKIVIIFFVIAAIVIAHTLTNSFKKKKYTIAILQCASFPPIDKARDAFITETKKLCKEVDFLLYNAENSPVNAYTIAQQISNNKQIDAFFTTDTNTTQALQQLEKNRPIVFIAVEKPYELGFLEKNTNMCGITDAIPTSAATQMIIDLTPEAKRIGLLCKNETTRKQLLEEIKKDLENKGYQVLCFTPINENDLVNEINSIFNKIDVLLSPADSMVGSTISLLSENAIKYKIPFLVCLQNGAAAGAFASRGTNYEENGRQAAQIMHKILITKKRPSDIPLQSGGFENIYINLKTKESLGRKNQEVNSSTNKYIFIS